MVEDEIFYLEKKVEDLRLRLRREQRWMDQCIRQQQQQEQQQSWVESRQPRHSVSRRELQQLPKLPYPANDEALECQSKASVGSAASAKGTKCSAKAHANSEVF
jgi:chromosome segregation ATPase